MAREALERPVTRSAAVVGEIPGNYVSVSMSRPREPTVASSNDKRALAVFQNEYIGVPTPGDEALGPAGVVRQIRYNGDGTLFAGAQRPLGLRLGCRDK